MIEHDEVTERLQRFYGEVRAQQRATMPAWNPPGIPRWRQPLPALAAVVLFLIAGVIAFAVHSSRPHVVPAGSPRASAIPSATSTVVPYQGSLVDAAQFLDDSHGWALSQTGLYTTSDGGATWTNVSPPISGVVQTAYFLDPVHGWATTVMPEANGSYFESLLPIFITSDGGRTWTRHDLHIPRYQAGGISLDFIDKTRGWLVAEATTSTNFSWGMLFRTVDGGVTWKPQADANGLPDGNPVRFLSPTTGWNVGSDRPGRPGSSTLYQTVDGGLTWNPQPIALPSGLTTTPVFALPTFADPHHGLLPVTFPAQRTLAIYLSDDGGRTWTLKQTAQANVLGGRAISLGPNPLPVAVVGPLSFYMAWDDQLEFEDNGSITDLNAKGFTAVDELGFTSRSTGWALTTGTGFCQGFKSDCVIVQYVIRTVDGGHTWTPLNIP